VSSPGRRRVRAARRVLSCQLLPRRGLLETKTSKISHSYTCSSGGGGGGNRRRRYNYLTTNPHHLFLPRWGRGSKVQHAETADLIGCLQKS